jgi:hypothetical protein
VSWNAAEVFKWISQFSQATARVLLRNHIDGRKLFRLNLSRLCDNYGLELGAAIDLLREIENVTKKEADGMTCEWPLHF